MPANTAAWINAQARPARSRPRAVHPARRRPDRHPQPRRRHQPARLDHPGRGQPRLPLAEVPDGARLRRRGRGRRGRQGGHPVPRGDRVLGHAVGTDRDSNRAAEGAFQQYTVVLERMASPIPDAMPFEDAAVLPLAVSTAACGLFQSRSAGAAAPVGERRADRAGSPGVGRLDQRRQQRHPAGRRRRLRGHHHGLAAQLRLREVARGRAVLRLQQPERHARTSSRPSMAARWPARSPSAPPPPRRAYGSRARAEGSKFVSIGSPPVSFDSLADSDRSRFELPRRDRAAHHRQRGAPGPVPLAAGCASSTSSAPALPPRVRRHTRVSRRSPGWPGRRTRTCGSGNVARHRKGPVRCPRSPPAGYGRPT